MNCICAKYLILTKWKIEHSPVLAIKWIFPLKTIFMVIYNENQMFKYLKKGRIITQITILLTSCVCCISLIMLPLLLLLLKTFVLLLHVLVYKKSRTHALTITTMNNVSLQYMLYYIHCPGFTVCSYAFEVHISIFYHDRWHT